MRRGDDGPLRLHILVAEDDPHNQRIARAILEGAGASVEIAPDGQAAIDLAARTRFDLIVMDVQMPEVDGLEATIAIRAAERDACDEPVPIVAFTAHGEEGLRDRCTEAGMSDYLVKPLAGHLLVEAVDKWVDRRPAVLVADDSPEIRRLLKQGLKGAYRVVEARNGREALRQFDRQAIALVLLDMNMPVLDGYAAAAAIRQRDSGRHVPIVALTGSSGPEDRRRAVAAGCTLHVEKPVSLAELRSAVETAMRPSTSAAADIAPPDRTDVPLEIDPVIADMVPGYLRDKRQQVFELRRFVAQRALDDLGRIAHDLKGTGSAYGVPDVTRIGRALESAAQQGDLSAAAALVEELDGLLARVLEQLGA